MEVTKAVLGLVGDHCDLEKRLGVAPPSAQSRGLYMQNIERAMERAGLTNEYRALCGKERFSALRFYPISDYLVRIAGAGALLKGPEHVHAGMYEVSRSNAQTVADSLLGRTLLRVLSRDPQRLLRQGVAGHRQTARGSHWDLRFPSARQAIMEFREELDWIESSLLGSAYGTMEGAGIKAEIRCELRDPFNGAHLISW